MNDLYDISGKLIKEGCTFALCTIVATKGSTPLKAGAKMLVLEDGSIHNTIGGGNLEKHVIQDAIQVIIKKKPQLFHHELLKEHGMCCGGTVDIFIEPVMPVKKLFVFGAGHVGRAIATYAHDLDFEIFLIDDREDELKKIELDGINKLPISFDEIIKTLRFDVNSFIIIVTYEHELDRKILAQCINQKFAYLGMIGSKRKVEITRKIFLSGGIANKKALDKVDMPMGYAINAQGPNEIAIGILAKIIELKNSTPPEYSD